MATPPGGCAVSLLALAALLFGAANSVATRALLQLPCPEDCGCATFAKPVWTVVIAFAAMALSLPAAALLRGGGGGGGGGAAGGDEAEAESEEQAIAALRRKQRAAGGGGGGGSGGGRTQLYDQLLSASVNDEDYGGGANHGNAQGGGGGGGGCAGAAAAAAGAGCCGCARRYAPLALPTLLDLLATALQGAAVLFVSAGVAAGLRGSLTLFAALAARCSGRGRDAGASRLEWAGISLAALGAGGVGLSAYLDADSGASGGGGGGGGGGSVGVALGVTLSLLSNLAQGVQVAAETALVEEGAFSPLEANGVEGAFGCAVALLALALFQLAPAPAVAGVAFDNGHIEDSLGTLCCLRASPPAAAASGALLALFALSTAAFMALGAARGGNLRALVMVARGAVVWAAELALALAARAAWWPDDGGAAARLGVAWAPHSYVALLGFLLLAVGGGVQAHGRALRDARGRSEAGAEEARRLAAVIARLNEGLGALEMQEFGGSASRGGRR